MYNVMYVCELLAVLTQRSVFSHRHPKVKDKVRETLKVMFKVTVCP